MGEEPPFKRGKLMISQKRLFSNTEDDDDASPNKLSLSSRTTRSSLRRPAAASASSSSSSCGMLLLLLLPEDLLFRTTNFLDAASLVRLRGVNRRWRHLASRSEAGWDRLCRDLWRDKVHVPPDLVRRPQRMEAYRESVRDAVNRHHVTLAELCYQPSTRRGTVWSFRFKESAGADWTSVDPWYSGAPCRKLVFLQDGTVKQVVPPSDDNNNNNNNNNNNDNNGTFAAAAILEAPRFGTTAEATLVDPPVTMTWRFLTRPMDLPTRPVGSYVRITVGGRDVPTYAVRRSPTKNWGFVMESCWGLFGSFELPARLPPPTATTTRRPIRRRLRRTAEGALWVDMGDSDESSSSSSSGPGDDQHHHNAAAAANSQQEDRMRPLRDDSMMVITNEIQWREAFLYNVGARVLPEGDEATDEFDRAWGGI